ncbi:MAG: nuclear transport factor 2 family protein [Balneolaceae bacterium]|nr:nuclear transport factor 2 family protein [Balneolaceae bacterium]
MSCSESETSAGESKPFPGISQSDSLAIVNTLMQTRDAWNRGDLEGFMDGYWHSEKLAFVGTGGPNYGYESTLERFRNGYPDREAMGSLEFEVLRLYQVDSKTALMIGRFYLAREMGDLQGHFTLVWQKMDDQWVIISDHSSGEVVTE